MHKNKSVFASACVFEVALWSDSKCSRVPRIVWEKDINMLKENSDGYSLIIESLRGVSVEVHFREHISRKAAVFMSFSMINSQNVCGVGLCRGYLRKWLLNIYNRSRYTLHSVLTAGALLSVNESSAQHQQPIITKWYWLTTAENNRPHLF